MPGSPQRITQLLLGHAMNMGRCLVRGSSQRPRQPCPSFVRFLYNLKLSKPFLRHSFTVLAASLGPRTFASAEMCQRNVGAAQECAVQHLFLLEYLLPN